jgi:hypothetical protein
MHLKTTENRNWQKNWKGVPAKLTVYTLKKYNS